MGELHGASALAVGPSSRQTKRAPASEVSNANATAEMLMAPVGPEVMEAFGATVSTRTVRVAGTESLPAASRATAL